MRSLSRSLFTIAIALAVLAVASPASVQAQTGTSVLSLLKERGDLSIGDTEEGALSSSDYRSSRDTYMEAWKIDGRAGESVTIDMISDDFDAFLFVVGPGFDETLYDDDSGGGCHARLSFTFLENGSFHVVATSAGPRVAGVYTLRASSEPGPTAGYECGGVNPATLTSLPVGDTISTGLTAMGWFNLESQQMDGRFAAAYALVGRAGERLTVTLESDDFDAYLLITGPGLNEVLSDDDGAGNYNSLLTIEFPEDGVYTVVATTVGEGATGSYTLMVDEPLDLNTLETGKRVIEIGGTMRGALTAADPIIGGGRYGQAWSLEGQGGQLYTIDLASSEFDCYIMLVGPGIEDPVVDDDSAGDLDSRLSFTLPEDGTYRVIVTSASPGETGAFELRVVIGVGN